MKEVDLRDFRGEKKRVSDNSTVQQRSLKSGNRSEDMSAVWAAERGGNRQKSSLKTCRGQDDLRAAP